MIYWAPFLHFYQPPTQYHAILEKISNESYRPLIKVFSKYKNAKVTINMCGVFTDMLDRHNGRDIISGIAQLARSGRLEFVESSKYHAILPLIPPREVRRQIELNHEANASFFGELYKPCGFFSPEMCYSDELARILSAMGYNWLLIAGLAHTARWPVCEINKVSFRKKHILIFYRDDVLSNKISFRDMDSRGFISQLIALSKGKKDVYVITAMDAETFGHHIPGWEKLFLAEAFKTAGKKESRIKIVTIGELLDLFPKKISPPPLQSSWSTTKEDMQNKNYYPLWKDSSNPIHNLQWEHVSICLGLVGLARKMKDCKECKPYINEARDLMDKALHSCQFWWANKGRMWNINMVNRGLMLQEEALFNAYKAISVSGCSADIKKEVYQSLIAARSISAKIRDCLFEV